MNATMLNSQHNNCVERSPEEGFSNEHKLLNEVELISILEQSNAIDKLIEYAKCFPFAEMVTGCPQRPLWIYDSFRFDLSGRDSLGRYIPVSEDALLEAYRTCNFYRKSMGEPLLDIPMRDIFATPDVGAFVEDITEQKRILYKPYYTFISKLCEKKYADVVLCEYVKCWPLEKDILSNVLNKVDSEEFCFTYYNKWGLSEELLKIVLQKTYKKKFLLEIYKCDDNLSDEIQQEISIFPFAEDFFLRYTSKRAEQYICLKQEKEATDLIKDEEILSSKISCEEGFSKFFNKYYTRYKFENFKILSQDIQLQLFMWNTGKQIFEICRNIDFPLCSAVEQKARELGWL